MEQASIPIPLLNRPNITLPACGTAPATGIIRNFSGNVLPRRAKAVVMLLSDDWGFGDVSEFSRRKCEANYPCTPNLDQLLKTGLVNVNYHTAAVCSPTRSSLMSARFPFHVDNRMHYALDFPAVWTASSGMTPYLGYQRNISYITTYLHGKGWKTGHFGKWHLGCSNTAATLGQAQYHIDGYKCYLCPTSNTAYSYPFGQLMFPAYSSSAIVNQTIEFIQQGVAEGRSVYVQVWFHFTHAPINLYPDQFTGNFSFDQNPYVVSGEPTINQPTSQQIYYAANAEEDRQIGRLFAWLETNKLSNDTLIAWSTDNGPENANVYGMSQGDPLDGRGAKRSLYIGGTRVPFVIKFGNRLQGVTDIPMHSVDWYPTLVGLLGYNFAEIWDAPRFDGMDLSPCILHNDPVCMQQAAQRVLIWENRYDQTGAACNALSGRYMVRIGNWTLYLNSVNKVSPNKDSFSRVELYNVTGDPIQSQNIQQAFPEVVAALTENLRAYKYYDTTIWPTKMGNNYQTYQDPNMAVGRRCVPK